MSKKQKHMIGDYVRIRPNSEYHSGWWGIVGRVVSSPYGGVSLHLSTAKYPNHTVILLPDAVEPAAEEDYLVCALAH